MQYTWAGWSDNESWMAWVDKTLMAELSYGFAGVGTGVEWCCVGLVPWVCGKRAKGWSNRLTGGVRVLMGLGIWYDLH